MSRRRREGAKQTIAVGPVASQVAIKMLGTNSSGFFNANAAHPFENPTALSGFIQCSSSRSAALTNVFGAWSATSARAGRSRHHGRIVHRRRGGLLLGGSPAPPRSIAGLTGGNMKARKSASALSPPPFAVMPPRPPATRSMPCDSFTALSGYDPVITSNRRDHHWRPALACTACRCRRFDLRRRPDAGRTPEYVGKKIEAKEVKMAMLPSGAYR